MCDNKIESCGKRIEQALTIRNMKQSELCKRASIPKSSLSLYLRGAYEPKQDRLYKMASVLHVNEIWLMGYDVPMEREVLSPTTILGLTESERIMLELFRQISEKQQKLLIQMVRGGLDIK